MNDSGVRDQVWDNSPPDPGVDWKKSAERLYRGFYPDYCDFEVVRRGHPDGWGVNINYSGPGRCEESQHSVTVRDIADIDWCYRDFVRAFCFGCMESADGRKAPRVPYRSDREMLFRLEVGGYL